ncbi:YitT family protein [Bacillus sp. 03113]|uniref:YitT family protein n=1 Tax=Bacillus sp. 03113 TaxID=2578211 RepID=UPI0011437970|nr:YitT family protein [Bacillus sp. 03113]
MKKILFILFGCLLTASGILFLRHGHLVTGGTAGLALSLAYLSRLPFDLVFFIINIPFYVFSFFRMGMKFTLATICSISTLTLLTSIDHFLPAFSISIWLSSILGGSLIGIGVIFLFKNGSSLGGAQILTLFLQKRFGFNPGYVNFLFDFIVVLISFYLVGITKGLLSILSIAVTSFLIASYKNQISLPKGNKKNYQVESTMALNK